MAKSRSRGGYRKPSQPAAVSGPGPLSQRTDGKQPEVRMPDMPYGQQKALSEQQGQAPLGDSGGANAPFPMQGQQAQAAGPDLFTPTEYKNEPITEGVPVGPGVGPTREIANDVDILLSAMYAVNPHPVIAELINGRSQ